MDRNVIYPIRIIQEPLPILFSETYCRLAFIAIAWIQKMYFYYRSQKKGLSEFLLSESECHGGAFFPGFASLQGRMRSSIRLFKRPVKLHICSNHTDNKHVFGIIHFQNAFKCWHCLERSEKFWHGNFHFMWKGQVIQEISSLFKTGRVAEPAWSSLVEFLGLGLGQSV